MNRPRPTPCEWRRPDWRWIGMALVFSLAMPGCAKWKPFSIASQRVVPDVAPVYEQRRLDVAKDFDAVRNEAQLAAARSYWRTGDVDRCRAQLLAIVRRSPENIAAGQLLAEVSLALDDCSGARAELERLLERNPSDAKTAYLLGLVMETEGNLAVACEHYVRATELDPNNQEYATHLQECSQLAAQVGP